MTRPSFATLPAATILAICDYLGGDGHGIYLPGFLEAAGVPPEHVQSVTRTYRSDGSHKGSIYPPSSPGLPGMHTLPQLRGVYSLDLYRRIAADLGLTPSGALGRGFEARELDRRIRQQVQAQEARP
jgi:hypothetical protein